MEEVVSSAWPQRVISPCSAIDELRAVSQVFMSSWGGKGPYSSVRGGEVSHHALGVGMGVGERPYLILGLQEEFNPVVSPAGENPINRRAVLVPSWQPCLSLHEVCILGSDTPPPQEETHLIFSTFFFFL